MIEQKNGLIINMSSAAAEVGLAKRASYAASFEGGGSCPYQINAGGLCTVLYVCNQGLNAVLRVSKDGDWRIFAKEVNGEKLRCPNMIVFDKQGRM
jgi:hypothetical protein